MNDSVKSKGKYFLVVFNVMYVCVFCKKCKDDNSPVPDIYVNLATIVWKIISAVKVFID
jgi:thioredoxin-related protein